MYRKAMHFGDEEMARRILIATEPKEIKALGRLVRNYSEEEWNRVCEEYMFQACLAKFSQDPKANKAIKSYPGQHFVEASPYDRKWGIGLRENDPRAWDSSTWRGSNLLGKTLDRVRDALID